MLELFKKYEVHVTWATVGMLFHESREELLENAPAIKPSYEVKELSAYHYIHDRGIGKGEAEDPFHFAPSIIQKITSTPYQELGTHTFAHYYCNEQGQTLEQFRHDLQAAQRAARKFGKILKSLVFPRNQFNDQYLKVCFEEGIRSVRSNPQDWFWHIESTQAESGWKRLNRGLDAYFPVGKKNTYKLNSIQVREGFPVCLPASRLLRPYRPDEWFLNSMKIARIRSEMTRAAERGEIYHLWWHPHNFGNFPGQSVDGLEKILKHYAHCRDKWHMNSLSMGELADILLHEQ
jgi:peptidoglycan/xylan/chitin deacetylase (PgdA/CDA1 family)